MATDIGGLLGELVPTLLGDDPEEEERTTPPDKGAGVGISPSLLLSQRSASFPSVNNEPTSMWDTIKDNWGTLLAVGALSALASSDSKRSPLAVLGNAGIDALAALGEMGNTRMTQQQLKFAKEQAQADKNLTRAIQLSNLGLKQKAAGSLLADQALAQGMLYGDTPPPPMGGGGPMGGGAMPPQLGQGAGQATPQLPTGDWADILQGANVKIPQQFESLVQKASQLTGVPEQILRAVMMVESGGDPTVVSKAGARGLMQLMPQYHPQEAMSDNWQNIYEGAKQLAQYHNMFGNNWVNTLRAYNWGDGNLKSWLKSGKGISGQDMPQETRNYVPKILARIKEAGGQIPDLQQAQQGGGGVSPLADAGGFGYAGKGSIESQINYWAGIAERCRQALFRVNDSKMRSAIQGQMNAALSQINALRTYGAGRADEGYRRGNEAEGEAYNRGLGLGKEYMSNAAYKSYVTAGQNLAAIMDSVKAGNGINDVALIFNFMKALDPFSVVRQEEAETAQKSSGLKDSTINAINKMIKGEQLTEEQRREFLKFAYKGFTNLAKNHDKARNYYTRYASKHGIDPAIALPEDPYATLASDIANWLYDNPGKDAKEALARQGVPGAQGGSPRKPPASTPSQPPAPQQGKGGAARMSDDELNKARKPLS